MATFTHRLKRLFFCSLFTAGPLILASAGDRTLAGEPPRQTQNAASPELTPKVPGTVIAYSPRASGLYIGSPSLVILSNGDYLASHDLFGPKSDQAKHPTNQVYRSSDRGQTWRRVATLPGAFWQNLFLHRGNVYLLGTDKEHGHIVIRRSEDNGSTWTEPLSTSTGLLTRKGEYHTAPMPVIEHQGRLWRAFEDATNGKEWGKRYQAGMLSAPVGADLLNATNWTFSNFLPRQPEWLEGNFNAWLEGNAVVDPDGNIVNVLRVDTHGLPEKAAMVKASADGRTVTFEPATGFIDFPGGAKKFTIRFDPQTKLYWSIVSVTRLRNLGIRSPASVRNTLALTSSADLHNWGTRAILIHHPDAARHGFQYVDWQFDGDDLIAACRTAYDDAQGGANNYHDANFLTFHRIPAFRNQAPLTADQQDKPDSFTR